MSHLKIWEKLLVAFAVVITANVFALVFLAADKNEPIAVAAKERTGLTYLKPVREIRSLVSDTRRLRAGGAAPDALVEKKVAIDLAMTRLDGLDLQLGWELGTTEDFVKLKKLWQQFKDSMTATPGGDPALEAKVHNSLRSLHALVADTSGLVLDPALDSYYLMDASVVKLANESELLSRLIDHTRRSATGAAVETNHDELLAMITLLKADIEAVKADLDVATDFNPELKLSLEEPRQQFERSAQQLLTLFERPAPGTSPAQPKVLEKALEDDPGPHFQVVRHNGFTSRWPAQTPNRTEVQRAQLVAGVRDYNFPYRYLVLALDWPHYRYPSSEAHRFGARPDPW